MFQIWLLVLALILFTRNVVHFKKISRLETVIIPVYSLVAGIMTIQNDPPALVPLVVTILVGIIVGWFQTTGLAVRITGQKDNNSRPVIEIRRNWQYLLGWFVIFAYGMGFAVQSGENVNVFSELGSEVLKDLFLWTNFSQTASWCILIQSASASIIYILLVIHKEPLVKAAISRKK